MGEISSPGGGELPAAASSGLSAFKIHGTTMRPNPSTNLAAGEVEAPAVEEERVGVGALEVEALRPNTAVPSTFFQECTVFFSK
jgi:hypothetical protein